MTLLFDESLFPEIDMAQTFLGREECRLGRVQVGPDLVAKVCTVRPDVLVLSDREVNPLPLVDDLRRRSELEQTRLVLMLSRPCSTEVREALTAAGVLVLEGPPDARRLADAVAQERAVQVRVNLRAPLVFEVRGRTPSNEVLQGQMLDVSAGGMRMRSEQAFEVGESIYCFFYLPLQASTIFATARVVRRRSEDGPVYEYGLSFEDIRLEDRRRIAAFVVGHASGAVESEVSDVDLEEFAVV